jgi:AcrR family transcriptional regulator
VPKLWSDTIEAHRRDVRQAVMDTTWQLVVDHGLLAMTMSRIAEEVGLGRATLYKYFPDVEAVLLAWHERHVGGHLEQLAAARDRPGDALDRLEAVLETYATIAHRSHGHQGTELAAFLHRDHQLDHAEQKLRGIVRELLAEAASSGGIRGDIAPDELASYCLHALAAAGAMPSAAAVHRLVGITLAGLRPPSSSGASHEGQR